MYTQNSSYIIRVHTCRVLSDFDGDYAPEIGTEDPLRTSCRRTSSQNPIALKIGLKVAGAPTSCCKTRTIVRRGVVCTKFWGKIAIEIGECSLILHTYRYVRILLLLLQSFLMIYVLSIVSTSVCRFMFTGYV